MTRGSRIAARGEALRAQVRALGPAVEAAGRVASARGPLIGVDGLVAARGARLWVDDGRGGQVAAEVQAFDGTGVSAQLLGSAAVRAGARAMLRGRSDEAAVGPGLLGRVIGPMGEPLDGRGPVAADRRWPLAGRPVPPLDRADIRVPLATGVRAIDALLTLGRGQRIGLMAGSGVGKSVLMRMLVAGAAVDAVVIALVGERGREIAGVVDAMGPDSRARTLVVAAAADTAAPLRVRAAAMAMAAAEDLRARGAHVLLLLDSLTRVAQAARELALLAGEPAGLRGWPASALGILPPLVERAGNDRRTGGAVTAIMTVLAEGDDLVADPVVDTARGVLDGHVLLGRDLAARGLWPAIDPAASLSRTMAAVVAPEIAAAAGAFRRDWALVEANRDLVAMGAHAPGHDPALDRALARRDALAALIAQAPAEQVPMARAHAALLDGWGGA
jgi:flagellum-specific ATP synthase